MYYALNESNIVEYVKNIPDIMNSIFKNVLDLEAVDLAEGNINLIFRVYSKKDSLNKSVLIKQALPHSRKYPEIKIPLERAKLEYEMLSIENMYCPGLVPKLYHYDEDMFAIIMEDLNKHIIMRYGLMKQVIYKNFAYHVGIFLARTLFYTSDLYFSSAEKKQKVAQFINPVLCKITEDLVFTEPYIDHPNNHWTECITPQVKAIHADDELRSEVLLLKEKFMTHAQALIHGDFHTGSIMVNEEETKIIDPEFGFFGPIGFDIGACIGNLLLSYASQHYHAKDEKKRTSYREWLLDTMNGVWNNFEKEFRRLWDQECNEQWPSEKLKDKYLLSILRDTAGFAAAKTMRRIIGLAQVPDMWTIEDDKARGTAQSLALNCAREWLFQRNRINSIDQLIELIRKAKPTECI